MNSFLAGLGAARIGAACVIVALYVATSAWFLWPRRRRPAQIANSDDAATVLVVHASQTGFAADLAERTARSLRATGTPVRVSSLQHLSAEALQRCARALFVVSTTGEGDAPDPAAAFVRNVMARPGSLQDLEYGVLALGDREYDNFCAFGHRVDRWLRHLGAQALFDVIEVDDGDEGALRHWLHQLSLLGNSPDLPDWETPRYEPWPLVERRLLNQGSAGDPCFHVALRAPAGSATWSAGDIAEIDPRNSTTSGTTSGSQPLPHREYSIASLPASGEIHLLVRQMRRPDGTPGLGSGWLTSHAMIGETVGVRIRANPNFHAPLDERPLILIGNGTGIAGLRALIEARIAAGRRRNWLIFGERNAAHDSFYAEDLRQWQDERWIERLDLVFSRDQAERRYVQHRLSECAVLLRDWVDQGAAIFVCGSLRGMAPGVDAVLANVLGADRVEALSSSGRYRRDVY